MRKLLTVGLSLFFLMNGFAQFRPKPVLLKYELSTVIESKPILANPFGLHPDPAGVYKYQSPALTNLPATTFNQSQSFWINNVTSQSYNNGRFGTYYYWDVQGNLQGTRGFIDLSGKNKRGVKLLFPWR